MQDVSTFDKTFDTTFTGRDNPVNSGNEVADVCRPNGVYLTWLCRTGGFDFYLFSGTTSTGLETKARTKIEQNRSIRQQKESTPTITVRTLDVSYEEAARVAEAYSSSSVWLVETTADNKLKYTNVSIDEGSIAVWNSTDTRSAIEFTIKLPKKRGQRI